MAKLEEIDVDYLEKTLDDILKFRWTFITLLVISLSASLLFYFTMSPTYSSVTRIIIEREAPKIVDFKEMYSFDMGNDKFYQTQYAILSSRFIAKRSIEKLALWQSAEINPDPERKPLGEKLEEEVINRFLKRLKVTPKRDTLLVEVQFEAGDPALSARAANAVVSSYIDYTFETAGALSTGTADILTEKIKEQRDRLEESEKMLQGYRERYNIISLQEEEKIAAAKMAEFSSAIVKTENERISAEARYAQASIFEEDPDKAASLPEVMNNGYISRLKGDEAVLMKDLSELSSKLGDRHPHIQALKKKLESIAERKNNETVKVISRLKNEYEELRTRESSLRKALEALKSEYQGLSKHVVAYGVLSRDVEANKQMYEVLLTKLKETGITSGVRMVNVKVLDKAEPKSVKVWPKLSVNLAFGVFIGVFVGLVKMFAMTYLDKTIKVPEDLERHIGIPYLGPVPSFKPEEGEKGVGVSDRLVTLGTDRSNAAEAYKGLRTSILFSSSEVKKSLLVTSTFPSEGKSVTAANLAVTMAYNGARTLLIDMDLRKPMIHKLFGITKEVGFTNLLVGAAELKDIIVPSGIENLDIIVCGHIPPNPAELLSSQNTKDYLDMLEARYDYVIVDAPPIISTTDPVILSTKVDEVMLVIWAGRTSKEAAFRAVQKLRQVRANVIGGVLNNVRTTGHDYYYSEYYYNYGKDRKAKKKGFFEKKLEALLGKARP